MKTIALFIALMVCSACTVIWRETPVNLEASNKTSTEYERDIVECNHYVYTTIPPMTLESRMNQLIDECMISRGYKRR